VTGDAERRKIAVEYVAKGLASGALKPVIDRILENSGQFGKIDIFDNNSFPRPLIRAALGDISACLRSRRGKNFNPVQLLQIAAFGHRKEV
jgi:hypothetical protein